MQLIAMGENAKNLDKVTLSALHPFFWIPTSEQTWVFLVLLSLTLVVGAFLSVLNRRLRTKAAPAGIITFEFAGDLPRAQEILESWGPTGRVRAGVNLGLDYLFLVAYASCMALGCVLVARGVSGQVPFLAWVGIILSWALLGAAVLDAVENFALIRLLLGSQSRVWPVVARWCALPKFLIVAVGLAYILIGVLVVVGASVA